MTRTREREQATSWLCQFVAEGRTVEPFPQNASSVVALAREHRLDARAGSLLAARSHPAAEELAELIAAWRRTLGEQALWDDVVSRLDHELATRNGAGLLLKGADLSRRVYGPGERPHNDLDLLVTTEDVEAAGASLRATGFLPEDGQCASARKHWFASTWRHAERPRLQVDLHTSLGPRGRVQWQADDVFARSSCFPGCAALRRLDDLDLVVHLALHAVAFHGASGRWIWWLDLHLAASATTDASALEARARDAGGLVALRAGLERARGLFGEPQPTWQVPGPRRGSLVAKLGRALERPGAAPRLGAAGRRVVAVLAVDRPSRLGVVARDVAARVLDRSRLPRGRA